MLKIIDLLFNIKMVHDKNWSFIITSIILRVVGVLLIILLIWLINKK